MGCTDKGNLSRSVASGKANIIKEIYSRVSYLCVRSRENA